MSLDCRNCEPALLDYVYEELEPLERAEVVAHLEGCESCRATLSDLEATRSLMAALPLEEPGRGDDFILQAAAREARLREGADLGALGRLGKWLLGHPIAALATVAGMLLVVIVSADLDPTGPDFTAVASAPTQAPTKAPGTAGEGAPELVKEEAALPVVSAKRAQDGTTEALRTIETSFEYEKGASSLADEKIGDGLRASKPRSPSRVARGDLQRASEDKRFEAPLGEARRRKSSGRRRGNDEGLGSLAPADDAFRGLDSLTGKAAAGGGKKDGTPSASPVSQAEPALGARAPAASRSVPVREFPVARTPPKAKPKKQAPPPSAPSQDFADLAEAPSAGPSSQDAIRSRLELGKRLAAKDRCGEAVREFDRVLKDYRHPWRAEALLARGRCYVRLGDEDRARSDYALAVAIGPERMSEKAQQALNWMSTRSRPTLEASEADEATTQPAEAAY